MQVFHTQMQRVELENMEKEHKRTENAFTKFEKFVFLIINYKYKSNILVLPFERCERTTKRKTRKAQTKDARQDGQPREHRENKARKEPGNSKKT
jgi:hypothetical protein